MNIRPSNSPHPKYPALAALAVAAVAAVSCQQQPPQRTAGAPLPPPEQRKAAPKAQESRAEKKAEPQRVPGKVKRPESYQLPSRIPPTSAT